MTNIKCNSRIEYTKGDTFDLIVSADSIMDSGTQLRFVIAKDENSNPVVDNTYNLNSNGEFSLCFSEENKNAVQMGDYIYKIVLISAGGSIVTQQSGEFIVKWGA